MCPFCILGISELSWVNVKFWFIFKRLFDEELYGIVVTMILTTVLEVCKEIIKLIVSLVNQESGNLVEFSSLDSVVISILIFQSPPFVVYVCFYPSPLILFSSYKFAI